MPHIARATRNRSLGRVTRFACLISRPAARAGPSPDAYTRTPSCPTQQMAVPESPSKPTAPWVMRVQGPNNRTATNASGDTHRFPLVDHRDRVLITVDVGSLHVHAGDSIVESVQIMRVRFPPNSSHISDFRVGRG